MNPSERDRFAKKVLATARSIVTYQVGPPMGCQRMRKELLWLAPHETGLPVVFEEYMKATQGLPLSSERLEWGREALKEKDVSLEAENQKFRDPIFNACWELIERFK
jgi:hypothetical protein